MVYSDLIEDRIDQIITALKEKFPDITNYRWCAIKLLGQDKEILEKYPLHLPGISDQNFEGWTGY